MDDDTLSSFESDTEISPSSDYSIDYWSMFIFSLYTSAAFGAILKRARHRPLHRHGVPTVGVVQSSRTALNAFVHTSFFVTVVFPTYQLPLPANHHNSESYVMFHESKSSTMEPLVDWKSTLVRKECQVNSVVYNEVTASHQVKMLFDPKAPLDAVPECMVKQPSNCSLFGSFLCNALLFVYVTCILIFWGDSAITFFQSDWTIQYLLTSMVVIAFGFCMGYDIIPQAPFAYKVQYHQNCKDDDTSTLDDVKLEEIAAANSLFVHSRGQVTSKKEYGGRVLHMSTKAAEVC